MHLAERMGVDVITLKVDLETTVSSFATGRTAAMFQERHLQQDKEGGPEMEISHILEGSHLDDLKEVARDAQR